MKNFSNLIQEKIRSYHPQGALDKTAQVVLALCSVNHPLVRNHAENVALLSEAVAIKIEKDAKAAFFGGLLHDTGKIAFPDHLFDGRNINADEYELVKKHALASFHILKESEHLFVAFIAGFHHAMYERGYGLTLKDFPEEWSPRTIKKFLELAMIVAICDDIEASMHRKTELKDKTDDQLSLHDRLMKKFPDDHESVRLALEEAEKLFKN